MIINTTTLTFFFNLAYLTLLAILALTNLVSSFKSKLEDSDILNISISAISLALIVFYIGFCIWFRNRYYKEEAKRKLLESRDVKEVIEAESKSSSFCYYGDSFERSRSPSYKPELVQLI
jgi:hypothetical protein